MSDLQALQLSRSPESCHHGVGAFFLPGSCCFSRQHCSRPKDRRAGSLEARRAGQRNRRTWEAYRAQTSGPSSEGHKAPPQPAASFPVEFVKAAECNVAKVADLHYCLQGRSLIALCRHLRKQRPNSQSSQKLGEMRALAAIGQRRLCCFSIMSSQSVQQCRSPF